MAQTWTQWQLGELFSNRNALQHNYGIKINNKQQHNKINYLYVASTTNNKELKVIKTIKFNLLYCKFVCIVKIVNSLLDKRKL